MSTKNHSTKPATGGHPPLPKLVDLPTVHHVLQAMRELEPGLRMCDSRQKGKASTTGWQLIERGAKIQDWQNGDGRRWDVQAKWGCVVPSTAGLYVVDLDAVILSIERYKDPIEATEDQAKELAALIGGRPYIYRSTQGKGKFHIVYADAANGGQDWRELEGITQAGLASQGGNKIELPSGMVAVVDYRGGGVYPDGHSKAGHVNGARVDIDRRRAYHLLRAMHRKLRGEVTPPGDPEVLAQGYRNERALKAALAERNKATQKAWEASKGLSGDNVHSEILTETARIKWGKPDDRDARLAKLKTEARVHRPDRDTNREIDDAYNGVTPNEDVYDDIDSMVADMNNRYAVLTARDMTVIDLEATAASDDLWPFTMRKEAFEARFAHKRVWMPIRKKEGEGYEQVQARVVPQWLKHPNRRSYEGTMELLGPDEKPRLASAYPIRIEAPQLMLPGDTGRFEEYIEVVLCNGDEAAALWLQNWMADIVQRPWDTGMGTGVILTGSQGSGKSSLFEYVMQPLLGRRLAYSVTNKDEMAKGFNHAALGKALLFWDEVVWKGDRALAQTMKGWTTAKEWNYRRKHVDTVTARNNNRHLLAANAEIPAHLESGDRRWLVIETPTKWSDAEVAAGASWRWFKPYADDLTEHRAQLAHHLGKLEYNRDELRAPPLTAVKREMMMAGTPLLEVLYGFVVAGSIPGDVNGVGRVAGETLASYCDGHMTSADAMAFLRRFLGAAFKGVAKCHVVKQHAHVKDDDGKRWAARLERRAGVQLPQPWNLMALLTPRLPDTRDAKVLQGATWERWKPEGTDDEEQPW